LEQTSYSIANKEKEEKRRKKWAVYCLDLEKISRRTEDIVSAHSLGHPVFLETSKLEI
jgi:hypothetical protein